MRIYNHSLQIILLLVSGLLFLWPEDAVKAADPSTPEMVVADFHDRLLSVMEEGEALGLNGRKAQLADPVGSSFDISFMARISVGNAWSGLNEEERQAVADMFHQFTLTNYATRFKSYSGQSFETLGTQEVRGGMMFVRTSLHRPDEEDVSLYYLMRQKEGAWLIADVFLDGKFSEVAQRRSEFAPVLRESGVEGLLRLLEDKIRELEEGQA